MKIEEAGLKELEKLINVVKSVETISHSLATISELIQEMPEPQRSMKLHELFQNMTDDIYENCDVILLVKPKSEDRCNIVKQIKDDDSIKTFEWVVETINDRITKRGAGETRH